MQAPPAGSGPAFQEAVLQHPSEFYRWLSELEAARGQEAAARFGAYSAQLAAHVAAADGILDRVARVSAAAASAAKSHAAVAAAGGSLAAQCEALERERTGR